MLTEQLRPQMALVLRNVETCLKTCNPNFVLCGMPVWKHVYHMLHSMDCWFINPACYEEPPFHEPGLNSLNELGVSALPMPLLMDYFEQVRRKITAYLETLTDEMLPERSEGCKFTRLELILGQFRHIHCHLGNINAATMVETGRWPRVLGLEPSDDSLYE